MMPMCTKHDVSSRHHCPVSVYGAKFAPHASRFAPVGLSKEEPESSMPTNASAIKFERDFDAVVNGRIAGGDVGNESAAALAAKTGKLDQHLGGFVLLAPDTELLAEREPGERATATNALSHVLY